MNKDTQLKIEKQETLDAYVTAAMINDLFLNSNNPKLTENIKYIQMPMLCNYDLTVDINGKKKLAVEIKERNKTKQSLEKYPYAEIKKRKLDLVLNAAKGNADVVYFVQLLNKETAYIFNLSKLDLDKCSKFWWTVKKTQMSNSNETENVLVIGIPYSLASKKLDIKKYYN